MSTPSPRTRQLESTARCAVELNPASTSRRRSGTCSPHSPTVAAGLRERRWALARRLLHDDTIPAVDRVAGLLLLLYAQRPAAICRLTTTHVLSGDGRTRIRCGSKPITLPEPVASLVRDLAATRHRGRVKDGTAGADTIWPFPGIRPGTPLDFAGLDERLKRIGLRPRSDRSTARSGR
ncbi:hypothetical protein [Streptomyces sp. NPDC056291]|uniref:hypothetical protein n=1 Tax=Streptomyces sp. NPDC056291 TaxID=3345772 RepID=UPI0035E136FC